MMVGQFIYHSSIWRERPGYVGIENARTTGESGCGFFQQQKTGTDTDNIHNQPCPQRRNSDVAPGCSVRGEAAAPFQTSESPTAPIITGCATEMRGMIMSDFRSHNHGLDIHISGKYLSTPWHRIELDL
jgi:hypothetical protein